MSVQSSEDERAGYRTPTEVRAYTDRSTCVHRSVYDNIEEHLRITLKSIFALH